ncbi:MAG: aldo/keto reductase [Verrucomicrobiales bacterium]|nr:aldo/keto reductase [Verrucomicrobiales bacterium]
MTPLPRRPVGNTGNDVSLLGLGTVKWGRNQQVKYPAFALPDDATLHRLLDVAEEGGVNLLDTAPAYGTAEERLGRILRERPDSRFVIATKTGEEFRDGQSHFHYSAAHTEASIHRSLRRLGVLTLDLVMVHCGPDDVRILTETPVLETLRRLQEQGLVQSIGVSTMTVPGGLLAVDLADVLMVPYSIGYREQRSVIDKAMLRNKGVFIKRALYSGPQAGQHLPLADLLRAVLEVPGVTSLIAGTINPDHLRENISTIATLTGSANS